MQNLRSLLSLALLAVLPSLAAAQLPPQLRDAARQAVVSNPEVQARWNAFQGGGGRTGRRPRRFPAAGGSDCRRGA